MYAQMGPMNTPATTAQPVATSEANISVLVCDGNVRKRACVRTQCLCIYACLRVYCVRECRDCLLINNNMCWMRRCNQNGPE